MLSPNLTSGCPSVNPEIPAPPPPTTPQPHPLLAGLRAFRLGRRSRTLSDHLRLADGPAVDHDAYLTECQQRALDWDRRRAEDIAAMEADPAWQTFAAACGLEEVE